MHYGRPDRNPHSHPIDQKFHPGIAELHPKLIHNTSIDMLGLRWEPYEKNLKKNAQNTIVPLPFPHKLNYFSFFQNFEKLFIICAKKIFIIIIICVEILIKYRTSIIKCLEPHTSAKIFLFII